MIFKKLSETFQNVGLKITSKAIKFYITQFINRFIMVSLCIFRAVKVQ